MKPSHALALALIPFLTLAAAVAATWSSRIRDVFFFAMVSLAVLVERMEVNFFSQAWYRGTTRGLQVTLLEILAFGLLVGCWVGRRDGERRWFWPASLGLLLLFLVYAVVSVMASDPKIYGAFELSKMLGGILMFLAAAAYVRSQRELTLLLIALSCAVGLEGLWALKQFFITRLDRVAGTLDHANSLSMYLCLTVPLLVAVAFAGWSRPLRWLCGGAAGLGVVGVMLTLSRAGIPVMAVVLLGTLVTCATWRMTPSRIAVRGMLAALALALVAAVWPKIEARYATASLEEEYFDPTIDGRGIYLRLAKMIAAERFFGVGLNNWSYHVSRTYGPRLGFRFMDYDYLVNTYGTEDSDVWANSYLAAPAHNLAALTLGELGVPGLIIFAGLWLRWFFMGAVFIWRPRTEPIRVVGVGLFFGLCGIFGQSLTEWTYRHTPILVTFYLLLGVLASVTAMRREPPDDEPESEGEPESAVNVRPGALVAERV